MAMTLRTSDVSILHSNCTCSLLRIRSRCSSTMLHLLEVPFSLCGHAKSDTCSNAWQHHGPPPSRFPKGITWSFAPGLNKSCFLCICIAFVRLLLRQTPEATCGSAVSSCRRVLSICGPSFCHRSYDVAVDPYPAVSGCFRSCELLLPLAASCWCQISSSQPLHVKVQHVSFHALVHWALNAFAKSFAFMRRVARVARGSGAWQSGRHPEGIRRASGGPKPKGLGSHMKDCWKCARGLKEQRSGWN